MYIGKIDISSLMKVDSLADNATKTSAVQKVQQYVKLLCFC